MPDRPARDAQEAPPWREDLGPHPRVTPFDFPHPMLRIRVDGVWRTATVRTRQTWADGRVAYQVDIRLPARPAYRDDPGALETYSRTYWWDPAGMRPIRE